MGRARGKDTSGEVITEMKGENWVGQKSLHQRDVKKVDG